MGTDSRVRMQSIGFQPQTKYYLKGSFRKKADGNEYFRISSHAPEINVKYASVLPFTSPSTQNVWYGKWWISWTGQAQSTTKSTTKNNCIV